MLAIAGFLLNTFALVYGLGRASKTLERVDKSLESLTERVNGLANEVAFIKGKDAARE